MMESTIGKLPPRYSFILNRYAGERLSRCPRCARPTHARKFALFIHLHGWGAVTLGKTCKYCSPCELIIAHQQELEAEMAINLSILAPEAVGTDYVVIGTLERSLWKKGLCGPSPSVKTTLEHLADFAQVLDLHAEPGGWRPPSKASTQVPPRPPRRA